MALKKELGFFLAVGISAALLHLLTVWSLVRLDLFPALQANIIGFLVAVNVSYIGHSRFTFNYDKELSVVHWVKFFSVAFASFLINQTAYFYALNWFGLRFYLPILCAILIAAATFTFFCSKFWVFLKHDSNR
jgi:putative flippase GtrA